jgi:hypothetical protein
MHRRMEAYSYLSATEEEAKEGYSLVSMERQYLETAPRGADIPVSICGSQDDKYGSVVTLCV